VFVARGTPMLPDLWRFHQLAHSGCSAITYARTEHVPNNAVVMVGPSKWEIKDAVGRVEVAPVKMRNSELTLPLPLTLALTLTLILTR
jgi:hypothetical protein